MLIPIVVAYAVAGVLAPGLRRLPVPRLPRLVGPAGLVLEGIGLAARTIAALLTLPDQVIAPTIAGFRSPRMGRKPITWTPVDRDYETLRIDLQTLFTHLGITTTQPAAA